MNLVIVPHSFVLIPFVVHPNNRVVDALLDDARAQLLTNDYYTDRFAADQDFVADELAALDVDFVLVDVGDALAVALTSAEFVGLEQYFEFELHSIFCIRPKMTKLLENSEILCEQFKK